jgi:hypothetical protein
MNEAHANAKPSGWVPRRFTRLRPTPESIARKVSDLLGGTTVVGAIEKLIAASPVAIPSEPADQCERFLSRLLAPESHYNLTATSNGRPISPGVTAPGDYFADRRAIEILLGEYEGGLLRANAVDIAGSGKGGAMCDCDVLDHRYVVAESDDLTDEAQAAVALKLIEMGLGIRSVVHSGGKSLHLLIEIGAADSESYREMTGLLFKRLIPLGFDPSTTNPSRLTRVPGFRRTRKDGSTGLQRLLYLR